MLEGISKALEQAFDPAFRAVALKVFAISCGLFFALLAFLGWLLGALAPFGLGWLDWVVRGIGGAGALVVSVLLFPAVATIVTGLFLDEIADAVDSRYYPEKPAARSGLVASLGRRRTAPRRGNPSSTFWSCRFTSCRG